MTAKVDLANSMEGHFQICIFLMIFFFCVDLGTSALMALHITATQIGGGTAHDAYIAFFGIALGIFRGMTPNQPPAIEMKDPPA